MADGQRSCTCWCGSTDFKKDKDGVMTCKYCGSKLVFQDGLAKFKILPTMDERQFVRNIWVQLARDDAPLEIFDCDFLDVGEIDYLAMIDTVVAKVPYQASIGYDREEAYLDTQSYTESVPYTDTISVYNSATKQHENRQVTRYKNVEKERQVTKYRTVTDWRPFSSEYKTTSTVCVKSGDKAVSSKTFDFIGDKGDLGYSLDSSAGDIDASFVCFDGDAFMKSLDGIEPGGIVAPEESECEQMFVMPSARREAKKKHDKDVEASLDATILGDRHKDLTYSVETVENHTQLFVVPEYYATIRYGSENYHVNTAPFGEVSTDVVEIENRNGLRAYRAKKSEELKAEGKRIEEEGANEIWQRNKMLSIISNVMLAVSILGLIAVGVSMIALFIMRKSCPRTLFAFMIVFAVLFVAAIVVFIVSRVFGHRNNDEIEKNGQSDFASKRRDINAEIERFTEDYRDKQLDLLNKKLASLKLELASYDDISVQGD